MEIILFALLEPPLMQPCRAEMSDLPCAGLIGDCGEPVTLRCPSCYVHRCARCTTADARCPSCATRSLEPARWMEDPGATSAHQDRVARQVLSELAGGADRWMH